LFGALTGAGWRPVVLAWVFVCALVSLPYVRAATRPPPGRVFVGFFYYVDDAYNYLSFVQQAEDGAFLLRNKALSPPRPARLVNLEWWLVGRVSALAGRRPALAYRLFGLAAALLLLAGVDRWMVAAGLPAGHRLPALLLVAVGGGLGGALLTLGLRPLARSPDLYAGLFPFVELFANPHFVAGTALLLWTLWAYHRARTLADHLRAALLGTALGLVRPYDLALVVFVHGFVVLWTEAPRAWPRRLVPLAGLLPVVAYDAWLFFASPDFAVFSSRVFQFPPRSDFVWALGPVALLAASAWAPGGTTGEGRSAFLCFVGWAAAGALILIFRPLSFSLQFLAGIGLPLLALGALGLARFPPAVTLAVAALLSVNAAVSLRLAFADNTYWFVPAPRMAIAAALRPHCRPGDMVMSPPDIGSYAGGLTRCGAYVAHPAAAGFDARAAEVRDFYARDDPAARAALLDRHCLSHVVLPGGAGDVPRVWLGPDTPFRRVAGAGQGPEAIDAYARVSGESCRAPRP
jgi:hypothetical protein